MRPLTLSIITFFWLIVIEGNVSFSQAIRLGDVVFDLSYGAIGLNSDRIDSYLVVYTSPSKGKSKDIRLGNPTSFCARFEVPVQEVGNVLVGCGLFYRRTNEQWTHTVDTFDPLTANQIEADRTLSVQSSAIGVSVVSHVYRYKERFDFAIASHIGFGFAIQGKMESALPSEIWIKWNPDLKGSIMHVFEFGTYFQATYFPTRRLGFVGKIGYAQRSGWLNAGLQCVI